MIPNSTDLVRRETLRGKGGETMPNDYYRVLTALKNLVAMVEEEDIEHNLFGCSPDKKCALCEARDVVAST